MNAFGRIFLAEPPHGATGARTLAARIVEEDVGAVTRDVGATALVALADARCCFPAQELHGMTPQPARPVLIANSPLFAS
jgi:hypothetical protein